MSKWATIGSGAVRVNESWSCLSWNIGRDSWRWSWRRIFSTVSKLTTISRRINGACLQLACSSSWASCCFVLLVLDNVARCLQSRHRTRHQHSQRQALLQPSRSGVVALGHNSAIYSRSQYLGVSTVHERVCCWFCDVLYRCCCVYSLLFRLYVFILTPVVYVLSTNFSVSFFFIPRYFINFIDQSKVKCKNILYMYNYVCHIVIHIIQWHSLPSHCQCLNCSHIRLSLFTSFTEEAIVIIEKQKYCDVVWTDQPERTILLSGQFLCSLRRWEWRHVLPWRKTPARWDCLLRESPELLPSACFQYELDHLLKTAWRHLRGRQVKLMHVLTAQTAFLYSMQFVNMFFCSRSIYRGCCRGYVLSGSVVCWCHIWSASRDSSVSITVRVCCVVVVARSAAAERSLSSQWARQSAPSREEPLDHSWNVAATFHSVSRKHVTPALPPARYGRLLRSWTRKSLWNSTSRRVITFGVTNFVE